MNAQIQKAIYYIEHHLDDELDVVHMAKVAGYSHFHFCRIFKLHVGESAISYVVRLRLERAARHLNAKRKSVTEVALDAGYQTSTGFLKAFKKRFGTTPQAYKNSTDTYCYKDKELTRNQPQIVQRDDVNVVFRRELGDYAKSSELAWKGMTEALASLDQKFKQNPPSYEMDLSEVNSETLGICHDDPSVTDESKIRYDAAIVWGEKEVRELEKYGFETKTIIGGKYAKVDYIGDANAEDVWYGLYAWIEKNGYTFRDAPAFEKYLDAWNSKDTNNLHTEVYVPIG